MQMITHTSTKWLQNYLLRPSYVSLVLRQSILERGDRLVAFGEKRHRGITHLAAQPLARTFRSKMALT